MSDKNNGGPAFPVIDPFAPQGMTMLDYFAAKAMQSILVHREGTGQEFGYEDEASVAKRAYRIANAMLAARVAA